MGYTGVRYVIQKGDTLWDLAASKLGDPNLWREILAFNNQADVIAAGARKIDNPDLIYAGAVLMLPLLPNEKPRPAPSAAPRPVGNLKSQIPSSRMPLRVAYELKGPPIVIDFGTFIARITQTGRVSIDMGAPLPLTAVLNGGVELAAKTQTKDTFTTLMQENKVKFDPKTNGVGVTFSNRLISSANNIPGPQTGVALEVSSTSNVPVLKVVIAYPQLKGQISGNNYVALDYKIEIEIEPRLPPDKPVPVRLPRLAPSPARAPQQPPIDSRSPPIDWVEVGRKARPVALILAGVVTVAYGASVVLSGGSSLAGSPAYAIAVGAILVGAKETNVSVRN